MRFWLAALALGAVSSPAFANPPFGPNCSAEPVIVGDSNGMQIGDGYRITVRDNNNNPVANAVVKLQFNGTSRPYHEQVLPAACQCPVIVSISDATGHVTVRARLGGFDNITMIQVSAEGQAITTVKARSTDLNKDGVTGIADMSTFRFNFLKVPGSQETDYDETGLTDIGDFSIFRQVFLNDVAGTLCP